MHVKNGDGAEGVFSYLTGRLFRRACEHAFAHGDFHMALVISQASESEDVRHTMLKQLSSWSRTQVSSCLKLCFGVLHALFTLLILLVSLICHSICISAVLFRG